MVSRDIMHNFVMLLISIAQPPPTTPPLPPPPLSLPHLSIAYLTAPLATMLRACVCAYLKHRLCPSLVQVLCLFTSAFSLSLSLSLSLSHSLTLTLYHYVIHSIVYSLNPPPLYT